MGPAATTFDSQDLPAGAPEELAGPAHHLAPVARQERISSVDTLRGFALLGILAMNIASFGLPSWAYAVPLSTPLPVFSGPHWRANTIAWFLRWVLAEGKMRALFSMLFGAGVILLTSRVEARGAADRAADIFTRRNMWLMLFGMLHCYLIWYGDILFFYGLVGLLFLYPMRKLKAKTLFRWAAVVLVVNNLLIHGGQLMGEYHARRQAIKADAALHQGKPLTDDQIDDLKQWKDFQDKWRPPQKTVDADMKAMHGGYFSAQGHQAKEGLDSETLFSYFGFGDVLGFMLLGMGLYRNGFLTAQLSNKTYAIIAAVGLGIAWPLIFAGCWHAWKSGFDMFVSGRWLDLPYEVGRVTGALGNAAVVLLLVKNGAMKAVTRRLAAVGQMALSNYLLTSISCKFLFVWAPPHWYGRMEYYHLYYVVFGVWAVNLIWSPIWLRHFQFGPAEWVWRSLTYWKRQPMRLNPKPAAPLATDSIVQAG